ncbi:MAG TPA: hypothetical protein VFQ77_00545 [Pseudonocardiaceae bacterium]|nr:hypothetical protein [Pseudonocardiaceae bacterium]
MIRDEVVLASSALAVATSAALVSVSARYALHSALICLAVGTR